MVGLNGLEPSTSRLSGGRSNQLSYKPVQISDFRCQTSDTFYPLSSIFPLLLCLEHSPISSPLCFAFRSSFVSSRSLQTISRIGCRASRLVEIIGIEPMTPCLQSRCSPSWAIPPCFSWVFKVRFNLTFQAVIFSRQCYEAALRTSKIKQRLQLRTDGISTILTLDDKATYFSYASSPLGLY